MKTNWKVGYKATERDMTCRGFQYEMDKIHEAEGDIELCKNGFHLCRDLVDTLRPYNNEKGDKKHFKVLYDAENAKYGNEYEPNLIVTSKIKFIEEMNILDYIREFKDEVNWEYVTLCQKLPDDFIREFREYIDWTLIIFNKELSKPLIKEFKEEFKDGMEWEFVSRRVVLSNYKILPKDFIKEFSDYFNWEIISYDQDLTEDFMREFKDYIDWDLVSLKQNLTEEFIREFQDRVNWKYIFLEQKLSSGFIKEFINKVD